MEVPDVLPVHCGGHDLLPVSTFSIYTNHMLTQCVFGILEKDFGLQYRKQSRTPVINP